jgi:AcrR family transcriptional regulator
MSPLNPGMEVLINIDDAASATPAIRRPPPRDRPQRAANTKARSSAAATISEVTSSADGPLRVEAMTSRQLVRRARLIETVIDLISEVGSEAVQMREVAERSGVALGTAYRYFRSKDHLLAAALADWQERLIRRVLSASQRPDGDPLAQVVEYLRRAQRAFHRNPEMALLMLRMLSSSEPDVHAAIDQMARSTTEMFSQLLAGLPSRDIPHVSFALDAILMSSVTGLAGGRTTLEESTDEVAEVARMLLSQYSGIEDRAGGRR